MKLITFVVPCYNSADYVSRCVESLVKAGNEAEVIVVDDGSVDDTPAIADRWAERYPDIVRVIHQPNGGHGEAINQGVKNASGVYFKVVDSDDWLDRESLGKFMDVLRCFCVGGNSVDMIVTDYVYEYVPDCSTKTVRFGDVLPAERIFGWKDIRYFPSQKYMTIHTLTYRTECLRRIDLTLPKHTLYVDNVFMSFVPPHLDTIYYLDVGLYHYLVGRSDQSINEKMMQKNLDDQLRITHILIHNPAFGNMPESQRKLEKYLEQHLIVMMYLSTIFLNKRGDTASREEKRKLWEDLKNTNYNLYRHYRYFHVFGISTAPNKILERISIWIYEGLRKIFRFS